MARSGIIYSKLQCMYLHIYLKSAFTQLFETVIYISLQSLRYNYTITMSAIFRQQYSNIVSQGVDSAHLIVHLLPHVLWNLLQVPGGPPP